MYLLDSQRPSYPLLYLPGSFVLDMIGSLISKLVSKLDRMTEELLLPAWSNTILVFEESTDVFLFGQFLLSLLLQVHFDHV